MLAAYAKYLTDECGSIQLDGLPADGDAGSRRLRLESLFVPLAWKSRRQKKKPSASQWESVLKAIRGSQFCPPGGGKSILLKRPAIAYVDSTGARKSQTTCRNTTGSPCSFGAASYAT